MSRRRMSFQGPGQGRQVHSCLTVVGDPNGMRLLSLQISVPCDLLLHTGVLCWLGPAECGPCTHLYNTQRQCRNPSAAARALERQRPQGLWEGLQGCRKGLLALPLLPVVLSTRLISQSNKHSCAVEGCWLSILLNMIPDSPNTGAAPAQAIHRQLECVHAAQAIVASLQTWCDLLCNAHLLLSA